MRDEAPLISRYKDFHMDEKKAFEQFCQQVGLNEEFGEESWSLWASVSTKVSETAKDTLVPWFVCTAYVTLCHKKNAAIQVGENGRAQPAVHDLLKVTRMRMVEFFQKMKEFIDVCDVKNTVIESLTELKRTFCISSALFYKFTRVMPFVLKDQAFCCESEKAKDSFFKTCWLLFIVCKGWQSHQVGDLMTAFYLLLCCVDFVHRKFFANRQKPLDFLETNITLDQGILPVLCQESNVSYSMVNAVHSQYFQPFYDSKSNTEGLLETIELNSTYEDLYRKCHGFDERDFFERDGCTWTPLNEVDSNATSTLNGRSTSTLGNVEVSSTPVTESRGPTQSLPVNDLQTVLHKMSDSPSEELLRFWTCCKKDPQELIQSQFTDVLESFTKGFKESVGEEYKNVSNEIFYQAKKLFYRVMEAMLLKEEKRLSCSDFSSLLNSKVFHISLMACSMEVVTADQALQCTWPAIKFPWILSVLGLKAFDFFKVIESFVLHEPLLGNNLVKHLNSLEEQVLESLAWTAESPVIVAMGLPGSDSTSENLVQQTKKSQSLNLFLRKVNLLAYNRLMSLCSKLDVESTMCCHMWTCLEQSLKLHWHLMKDRHLDQMILCAVYAIPKVLGKEIQFKQIVTSYKSLPFASSCVYKGDCNKGQDTIIGFYNRVYMVAMKSIILQFAPNKIPPVSPSLKSSVRVAGTKNFYLSPLRNSPSQTLSPRSRSLYSFGDSPGSGDRASLSRINASMRTVQNQPNVPQKRLRFDDCDFKDSAPTCSNGHTKNDEEGTELNVNQTKDNETS